ncbi:MAG: DnaJ domain-containing protein, partial [Polyangiaceae bacterium]
RNKKVTPDPAVDEVVDLDAENRQRITELFAKLERATHYEVLGIPLDSDKKAVKRAYFELATHVHPDRFFRKNLGSYKPKMEAVFVRVTLAHDILTSKEKRPEYDAYLGARASARRIESLSDLKAVSLPSHSLPIAGPSVSDPVPAPAPQMLDDRGRRELLARRLGRSSKRPSGPGPTISNAPAAPISEPKITPAPDRSSDPDALKRLFEERLTQARSMQARKHAEAGDDAILRGDVVAAATSFKTALSFLPDDPDITQRLVDVTDRATLALAEAYRKQALYEEKNGQWVEAARSWTRLAKLLPADEDVQDSAAKAIVQGGGDLHEAATFAQRAVNDNPESARFRKTLGSVYLAAGLKKNARRELEAAARISPDDDTIQDLLKRAM